MVEGSGVGGDLLKKSVTLVLVNALSNDASLFCNPMLALMIFFFFSFHLFLGSWSLNQIHKELIIYLTFSSHWSFCVEL